jgi:hypothetical protein
LVNTIKEEGLENAIAKTASIERVPKELAQARSYAKTVHRNLKKMLKTGVDYHGPLRGDITEELRGLHKTLEEVISVLATKAPVAESIEEPDEEPIEEPDEDWGIDGLAGAPEE